MLFRKLVSNLPFSPALLNQVGFYAKRLQREQATRRLGMLFTALAVLVQMFSFLQPPEAALAANPSNMIFNGLNSREDLLQAWDANSDGKGHKDIQQIFKYFLGADFSRKDLENTKKGSFGSRDKQNGGRIFNLSRVERTADPQRKAHIIRDANGAQETLWAQHLDAYDTGANTRGRGSMYEAFIGSHNGKWFAIMLDCGNLAIPDTVTPPPITPGLSVQATCREIKGYAYDQSAPSKSLKVYIYMDGDPSNGKRFEVVANKTTPASPVSGSHGFSFTVPVEYHTGKKYSYAVVALPAYTENQTKQFKGTLDTASCKPAEPIVSCTGLTAKAIDRNNYALKAQASTANGGKIQGYHYTVAKDGTVVVDKKISSTDTNNILDVSLENDGKYTAKVAIITASGEKNADACVATIEVAPVPVCGLNPTLPADSPDCKPCEGDDAIWQNAPECAPQIVKTKSAKNLTQNNSDATKTTAKSGDRIQYSLYVENAGKETTTVKMEEDLSDVLEYADLTEKPDDGARNPTTNIVTWNDLQVKPGQRITKTIVVTMKTNIPGTPKSVGNLESYDCKMGNAFGGTEVVINVACPEQKIVENTVEQLPATGTGSNALFSITLLVVVTYFYMRSRQLNKELRLLKQEFNYGKI